MSLEEELRNPHNGPSATSLSLLLGLRNQQHDAWSRFVCVYGPLLWRWCTRFGVQANDIEDIIQEVYRVVATRIGDFRKDRPGDSFRGWLWGIVRNKLGDYWRREKAQPRAEGGTGIHLLLQSVPQPDEAEPEIEPEEVAGVYRRALEISRSEFEEKTWQAFWMVVCESRLPRDVAEQLEMSLNAVYLAKSRVLRVLREALGDAPDSESGQELKERG